MAQQHLALSVRRLPFWQVPAVLGWLMLEAGLPGARSVMLLGYRISAAE
jgi:hypothetical protein